MSIDAEKFKEQMLQTWKGLQEVGWHWFRYHFMTGPTPFAMSIFHTCASLDESTDGIGRQLLADLLRIGGRERDEDQYEQLLQKLAEILVLERIVSSDWPEGTTFEYEPEAVRGGPRPELLVTSGNMRLVIEVKAPSLLRHIRNRASNATQLAYRDAVLRTTVEQISEDKGITLPRDNPVLDFLKSANRKFEGFRNGTTASLLVIVWDDYIYEPISVLMNERSGLLTPQSFQRDAETGAALTFPNVDAIVVLRHLNYFIAASREEPLGDRLNGMDFGSDRAMPNVAFGVSNIEAVPQHVYDRLRALPYGHDALMGAEYHVADMVFWVDVERYGKQK
ncbi:hypothetical protein [Celeribacter halophilus]|uniref:hypothetical protein n=1 Tax=Celeribacter halophilus TaxID=576117 RepID=UPI003A914512